MPFSTAILIIIGHAGTICYLQQSTNVFPSAKIRRKSNAPWITKELIVLSKKKKSLYNRARRSNKTAIWEKYRQLNNSVKRICNTARWSYIKKLALDLQENDSPKPFWNFVKSKRRGTNNLVSLNVDGSVLTDDSRQYSKKKNICNKFLL